LEQHVKGFRKAVREPNFFPKDLDLGFFDPLKDLKDGVLLDEKDIAAEEEVIDEGQSAIEQGNDACV